MVDNLLFKFYQAVKKVLGYQPPTNPDSFVLDENHPFDSSDSLNYPEPGVQQRLAALNKSLQYAHHLEIFAAKLGKLLRKGKWPEEQEAIKLELAALEKQFGQLTPLLVNYDLAKSDPSSRQLSTSIEENSKTIASIYRVPKNKDIVIRNLRIAANPPVKTIAVFTDGLVDNKTINLSVLQPLMLFDGTRELYQTSLVERIINECLPSNQVKRGSTFAEVEEAVNSGDTVLIFDGIDEAVLVSTKGWEHRGVDHPLTEQSVRGAQAAFSENLRINTGLVRSMLRSSDLVTEMVKVGTRSQVNCAIMYIDSIANSTLVAEVRRRIQGIEIDYLGESGELIQLIEDFPNIPYPQSLSTERPDRVVANLMEGRVALILEGNPFAHIIPISFFSFFHSAEDFSVKSGIANIMRVLRLFGALIATVLPSLYLAISYFHQEALPTELLLAVSGSRENVPFPAWFEILVMDTSFELIREAGVRIPGILGSTIGIVGAIILGQAAVSAHIVSPIIVVIIAITGLASFTIPEYRMSSAMRITRFVLLFFAAFMGLVGLGTILLWLVVLFCRMKSFGVPYMAPIAPRTNAGYDVVLRGPVFKQENRPDELNPKDKRRQPFISRLWKTRKPEGANDQ